jgi:hypothetical protein
MVTTATTQASDSPYTLVYTGAVRGLGLVSHPPAYYLGATNLDDASFPGQLSNIRDIVTKQNESPEVQEKVFQFYNKIGSNIYPIFTLVVCNNKSFKRLKWLMIRSKSNRS